MAARDLFDPTRFSNCGCGLPNGAKTSEKIASREKGSFIKILDKIEKVNSNSSFVKKAKELVNVSNRIYDNGSIPAKFAIGINGVLDHLGAKSILDVVEKIDVDAANGMKTSMGNVSDKLRSGNLRLKDMDGLLSDVTRMQKYAKGLFGGKNPVPPNDCICHPEVYARHIANNYFPKYASLYAVRFHVREDFAQSIHSESTKGFGFEFLCSKISRPSIEYDVEEINRYNHRTYVQKKATFGNLQCEFLDDDQNYVHDFFERVLAYYTPSMALDRGAANENLFNFPDYSEYHSASAPQANNETYVGHGTEAASSKGPEASHHFQHAQQDMTTNFSPLITHIEIFHMHKFGRAITKYDIFNPVLKTFTPSELDSEGSSPSTIACEFAITNFTIEPVDVDGDSSPATWNFAWNRGDASGTVLGNYDGIINTKATVMAKLKDTVTKTKKKSLKERLKEAAKNLAKALAKKLGDWAKNKAKSLLAKIVKPETSSAAFSKLKNVAKSFAGLPGKLVSGGLGLVTGFVEGTIKKLDGATNKLNQVKVIGEGVTTFPYVAAAPLTSIPMPEINPSDLFPSFLPPDLFPSKPGAPSLIVAPPPADSSLPQQEKDPAMIFGPI